MNVSMRKITVALVLAGLLIGCVPADAPSQPGQILAPAPVGAPGPTRVYDVPPPPPSLTPQTVVLAQTAEPAAEPTAEPTDSPVAQASSLWSGSLTILHTNDSVGYLDPCG